MKLPTWLEANRNVANKTANPIDVFIDNNEPAGLESEEKFREELEKMLEYVRLLTQPAPDAGESAPLQALSTPEHSATSQNLSTPTKRR